MISKGTKKSLNNRFLRERGMASNHKMEYQVFLCIFQKNAKMRQPTGQTFFPTFPKEFSHFLQTLGSHSWVLLENAKKNLVFHFGVGHHASFPQKPVVNSIFFQWKNQHLKLHDQKGIQYLLFYSWLYNMA